MCGLGRFFSLSGFVLCLMGFVGPTDGHALCGLDSKVEKHIAENTFKLIPIRQAVANFSFENAQEYLKNHCDVSNQKKMPASDRLNCEVMRRCNDDECAPIFGSHGTAFLTDGGTKLRSAWHVVFASHQVGLTFFSSYLDKQPEQEKNKIFASLAPSFVLLNQQDQIVYDTRDASVAGLYRYESFGDPLTPLHHESGVKKGVTFGHFENIPEDHVTISLGKSLGVGLRAGTIQTTKASANASECVYTAGYVHDGTEYGYRINHGYQSHVTALKKQTGAFLDFVLNPLPMSRADFEKLPIDKILSMVGYSHDEVQSQLRRYSESQLRSATTVVLNDQQRHLRDRDLSTNPQVFFSTIPASNGQSGGPLFNERGEWLGITTNAFLVRRTGKSVKVHSSGAAAWLPSSSLASE